MKVDVSIINVHVFNFRFMVYGWRLLDKENSNKKLLYDREYEQEKIWDIYYYSEIITLLLSYTHFRNNISLFNYTKQKIKFLYQINRYFIHRFCGLRYFSHSIFLSNLKLSLFWFENHKHATLNNNFKIFNSCLWLLWPQFQLKELNEQKNWITIIKIQFHGFLSFLWIEDNSDNNSYLNTVTVWISITHSYLCWSSASTLDQHWKRENRVSVAFCASAVVE